MPIIPDNRDERQSFRGTTRNSPKKRRSFLEALTRSQSLTEPSGAPYFITVQAAAHGRRPRTVPQAAHTIPLSL